MARTDTQTQPGLYLQDGVELVGRYQDSGLKEPPYLVRRGDGHTVQVSWLVYLVAEALATYHHPEAVADAVTLRFGREVSPENILYLVENKLVPVGLVATGNPEAPPPVTANPLLALRLRVPLVPETVHRIVTRSLTPLFWPPIVVAALSLLVVTDVWLATTKAADIGRGMQMILFEPKLLLVLTVMTLVAGIFHEMGHAAAARYGGATPGAMGAGVYVVWPVFYTDLTDAYRLDRRNRLRTDLGGVYFNVLFSLGTMGLFWSTGYHPLLVLAVVVQLETVRQFLPIVRLDGYYIMSDLAGVPNLFAYMRPVLTTLVRRGDSDGLREARQKLGELTRRARVLIVGWVVITAPVLAVNVVLFLFFLPRLAGVAWGSAGQQLDAMQTPGGGISPVGVLNGTFSLILLALPVLGMSYLLTMILNRGAKFAARWWPSRPAITGTATCAVAGMIVLQIGTAWPDTFGSALREARGDGPADGLETALSEVPAGLNVLTRTTPDATPILVDGPDEPEEPEDPPADLAAPADEEPDAPATSQPEDPGDRTGEADDAAPSGTWPGGSADDGGARNDDRTTTTTDELADGQSDSEVPETSEVLPEEDAEVEEDDPLRELAEVLGQAFDR